jgi:ATP-dependent Clp protease, protease subunit
LCHNRAQMPKPTTSFYEILNQSTTTKTVDILIYGSIPSFDYDTYKMKNSAEQFVRDFQQLEKDYDRINIHLNSPGGSVYHAFPIFNILKASKKDIHTYNDGLCASAASILLLAGKKIHSAKNGMVMIHNALNIIWGNAEELREAAGVLDKYDGVLASHYAEVSGKTKEDILAKYFDYKDHWLTAEEAKEEGLIHEIEDYESEDAPPSNIANMAFDEVMNLYREKSTGRESFVTQMANRVRSLFAPAPPTAQLEEPINPPTPSPIPTNTDTMDFKNSLGILAKGQITPEDVAAIKAEIEAFTGVNEKFTAEEVTNKVNAATEPLNEQIQNLTTEKQNLATQVNNLTTEKTALETEKTNLSAEVSNLKTDIAAYRASGVKPTQPSGSNPDKIEDSSDDSDDFLYSEADAELAKIKAEAGITAKKK